MEALRRGDPAQVGPYRIEGRLGEGGMGRVFLGASPGGRQVAVKLIRAEHAADPRFRARFAREVDAARRVGGFHTAQVVDADADAEAPWMAAAFVPGPSLRDRVAADGPLGAGEVRRLGAALAEGLAAIHACGLVHRDLKPGNVIMSPDGPRIIDFGIARADGADPLTADGTVIGTYTFMAPEQMLGEHTGPPADVFSLGCVLVYAAIGRGPFDASTVPAVVHRVLHEDPPLTGVPMDLARVIAACLAKTPDARPAVADLIGHLTSTRPGPLPDPPAPSHPAGATTVPPATLVAPTEAGIAPDGTGRRRIPRRAVLLGAVAVATAGGAGALVAAARRGESAPPPAAAPERIGPTTTLTGHTGVVEAVAFSPDGRFLATAGSDAPRIWDAATARTLRTLDAAGAHGVAFSPDGKLLATAHDDSSALWDVSSGRRTETFRTERFAVWTVAFSPDGRTLATGNPDVRLWDLETGRATVFDTGPFTWNKQNDRVPNTVMKVEFSPDGKTLAAALTGYGEGGGEGAVLVWDVATRQRTALLRGPTEDTLSLAFAGSGASIATCGESDEISLWDVAARRVTASLTGHLDEVRVLAAGNDGTTLASCGLDRNVHLWDVGSRRTTAVLTGHTALLETLALSPDGRTVAAGGGQDDHAVRIWKVR